MRERITLAARRLAVSRWTQIAETSAVRIYLVIVSLLSTAITARYLGPEGRGVLVAALGWVSMFTSLGYMSMAQPLFRRVNGKAPSEWLPEALGTLIGIVGVITVIGWVLAASAFWLTGGEVFKRLSPGILVAALVSLPFTLWGENGNSIFLAMGRLRALNLLQVLAGTASLAAVYLASSVFNGGITGALLGIAINPLLLAVVGIGMMFRIATRMHIHWKTAKQLLSEGARLHLSAVGSLLSGSASLLILNYYRPASETAYLHLAGQMLIGLSIVPGALSSVTYTMITRDGPNGAWPAHKRLLLQALLIMTALCAVAYAAAPFAVQIIAGDAFRPVVPVFRMLLPTVVLTTVAVGTVSQWVARGLFWWLAIYGLILGSLSVVLMFLMVPRWGVMGAVYVSLISSLAGLLMNIAVIIWIDRRAKEWNRSQSHTDRAAVGHQALIS